jgi:hypothetical protein
MELSASRQSVHESAVEKRRNARRKLPPAMPFAGHECCFRVVPAL